MKKTDKEFIEEMITTIERVVLYTCVNKHSEYCTVMQMLSKELYKRYKKKSPLRVLSGNIEFNFDGEKDKLIAFYDSDRFKNGNWNFDKEVNDEKQIRN